MLSLRALVRDAVTVRDGEAALAAIAANRPRVAVIDAEHPEAQETLRRIAALPRPPVTLYVVHDGETAPVGANAVVDEVALRDVLAIASEDFGPPILATDHLLTASLLAGVNTMVLDDAVQLAADQIAAGFAVERCVISLRGDSTAGSGAASDHTWDSLAWSRTAGRCRASAAAATTHVTSNGANCESYLAVPLDTPVKGQGFVGVVSERARIFPKSYVVALRAIGARLSAELAWRTVHQRTADELDRALNAPGRDQLLGIWNALALAELAASQVSAARRSNLSLSVVVLDVQDLQGINTRYGLDTGDRVLQRIADALRAMLRNEDLIGRRSGGELAILLHNTTLDGAQRVADRLRAALATRPLDLPGGGTLAIPLKVGLAGLQAGEEAGKLMARAAWAAKHAEGGAVEVARPSVNPLPSMSGPIEIGEIRATLGGAYRLLHEISRGGMGVVYRAEDLALERPVAIKMLRPDLAEDAAFVDHLRGEAAMLARLQHPNLVQIYNFGQSAGDSYFVMELVEGESLQQAIDRHRIEASVMSVAELIATIEQIGSALDALHERGIVHRDVKPANVIRDPFRNRSVLVDVGIARRYGQFVESAGTPGYAAPEVIAGGEATPRSDVYGFAATAYTMLTLATPWGDDDRILTRQLKGTAIAKPSSHRPELAPADDILLGGLDRNPALRPASAGDFARALRDSLVNLSPPPKPDAVRWAGATVFPTRSASSQRRTRGVVFRSVGRALGVRDAELLRDALGGDNPELARALVDCAPLEWLPTELLSNLLATAPGRVERDGNRLARDIARATVRASFRRFFPASAATLVPERTLAAIRNVWSRYHTWGAPTAMPVHATETIIRFVNTPRDHNLCAWTSAMLEQLVVLSGARTAVADHEACEARGDDACLFRVIWETQTAA